MGCLRLTYEPEFCFSLAQDQDKTLARSKKRLSTYKYKYNGKELQEELGLNLYDFGGRQYMQDLGRTTTIDPLAEKFYDLSPQSFLNNNPLRFIDPTGMASEDNIDDPGKKQTATQRAYNPKTGNTDIAKLVMYKVADVLESVNTYVKEKIETSDKDLTTTATSKKGGNENQKTTGKAGDKINADAFLEGAPGKAKNGNNFLSNKDVMNAAADFGRLASKLDKTIKSVTEVVKENTNKGGNTSDMVYIVKDDKNPNNNVQVSRAYLEAQQKKKE